MVFFEFINLFRLKNDQIVWSKHQHMLEEHQLTPKMTTWKEIAFQVSSKIVMILRQLIAVCIYLEDINFNVKYLSYNKCNNKISLEFTINGRLWLASCSACDSIETNELLGEKMSPLLLF